MDACAAYELELRKSKKIIPVDNHFITVVVPDFNEKKSVLNVNCKYILFLFSLGCCMEIL